MHEHTTPTPERLWTVKEVATAIGCHQISLYKAVNGQLAMPAPKVIRIGRLVRVRDCDFQAFLNGLGGVKLPVGASPSEGEQKRRGRPTKAMQLARRAAAAQAKGGAA